MRSLGESDVDRNLRDVDLCRAIVTFLVFFIFLAVIFYFLFRGCLLLIQFLPRNSVLHRAYPGQLRPWEPFPSVILTNTDNAAEKFEKNLIVIEWICDEDDVPSTKKQKHTQEDTSNTTEDDNQCAIDPANTCDGAEIVCSSKNNGEKEGKLRENEGSRNQSTAQLKEQNGSNDGCSENTMNNFTIINEKSKQKQRKQPELQQIRDEEEGSALKAHKELHLHLYSELGCAICLKSFHTGDLVTESNNVLCQHIFHKNCIMEWLKRQNCCPVCRHKYVLPVV